MQRLMYFDIISYLPDDILVKVDRASMGVSLESRAPLLDHRVVEFAWRVPVSMKVRHGQTEMAAAAGVVSVRAASPGRAAQGRLLCAHRIVVTRPAVRSGRRTLINEARLQREGFFEVAPIRRKWEEHLSGTQNWQSSLWNVLMFQAWLENQ